MQESHTSCVVSKNGACRFFLSSSSEICTIQPSTERSDPLVNPPNTGTGNRSWYSVRDWRDSVCEETPSLSFRAIMHDAPHEPVRLTS